MIASENLTAPQSSILKEVCCEIGSFIALISCIPLRRMRVASLLALQRPSFLAEWMWHTSRHT